MLMSLVHGYKAKYDYVELSVEQREGHWVLLLNDRRHGVSTVHDEEFATAAEAPCLAGLRLCGRPIKLDRALDSETQLH
jgi:hypothetical protein